MAWTSVLEWVARSNWLWIELCVFVLAIVSKIPAPSCAKADIALTKGYILIRASFIHFFKSLLE